MTDLIRVLLVDDQDLVRSGVRMILGRAPDIAVVGEAADGAAAIDAVDQCRPHVVLMDIRMPRLDGIAATARIVARPEAPKVVILTTFDLDEHVYDGLRAGASGYVLKDTPGDALIAAIRTVAAGQALLHPAVTRQVIEHFVHATPRTRPDDRYELLTDREKEVLLDLARGLSNAEIGARLYLGEATVKTHVGRILAKLELRDRTQAVIWAYETGLVQPGAPTDD